VADACRFVLILNYTVYRNRSFRDGQVKKSYCIDHQQLHRAARERGGDLVNQPCLKRFHKR